MKDVWAGAVLEGFEGDDGMDCVQTLRRLVEKERAEAGAERIVQVIVVGHCESQVELAWMAGIPYRLRTPFCGVAVFEIHGTDVGIHCTLIREPKVVDGQVPAQIAASNITG